MPRTTPPDADRTPLRAIAYAGLGIGLLLLAVPHAPPTVAVFGALAIVAIGTAVWLAYVHALRELVAGWRAADAEAEPSADGADDPVADLRERYVAGELTEAEFERRVRDRLDDGDTGESSSAPGPPAASEGQSARESRSGEDR